MFVAIEKFPICLSFYAITFSETNTVIPDEEIFYGQEEGFYFAH